jgi:hypothetical protein
VVATGAALSLEPHETSAAAVAQALSQLLHESPYRAAAARLRSEIDAMPRADEVIGDLAG